MIEQAIFHEEFAKADAPDLVKIEVLPSQRVFHALGTRQQLRINGYSRSGFPKCCGPWLHGNGK